jgi:hypothetical protein
VFVIWRQPHQLVSARWPRTADLVGEDGGGTCGLKQLPHSLGWSRCRHREKWRDRNLRLERRRGPNLLVHRAASSQPRERESICKLHTERGFVTVMGPSHNGTSGIGVRSGCRALWGAFCSGSRSVRRSSRFQSSATSAATRLVSPPKPNSAAVCATSRAAFEVAVGAAGEAEVGVVELTERGMERCLESGVDVARGRERSFGLVVVAEEGGGAGQLVSVRCGAQPLGRVARARSGRAWCRCG